MRAEDCSGRAQCEAGYPAQVPPPRKRAPKGRCVLPGRWNLLTTRVVGGRYAFLPTDPLFTARVWGIIGVGMRRYGVQVAAFALLGNHYHMLARARRRAAVSAFMQWVNSRLAELTHELHGTHGKVWEHKYGNRNLLDDAAEAKWLRYILAHSVKEQIVPCPTLWPGPHSAGALVRGEEIRAVWFKRGAWVAAGAPDDKTPYLVNVPVELTPLTRWQRAPEERWRAHCQRVVDDIVDEYAERHFVGVAAPIERGVHYLPARRKRSPNRLFDARGEHRDELLKEAYQARRDGVDALAELNRALLERGHAAIMEDGTAVVPEGFDWPASVLDATENRPIVAEFHGPPKKPPRHTAAA